MWFTNALLFILKDVPKKKKENSSKNIWSLRMVKNAGEWFR